MAFLSDTFTSTSTKVVEHLWTEVFTTANTEVQDVLEFLFENNPQATELRNLADTYNFWAEKNLERAANYSLTNPAKASYFERIADTFRNASTERLSSWSNILSSYSDIGDQARTALTTLGKAAPFVGASLEVAHAIDEIDSAYDQGLAQGLTDVQIADQMVNTISFTTTSVAAGLTTAAE